jgi:hypothetical protein
MKRIKPRKPLEFRLVIEVGPYHWSDRRLAEGRLWIGQREVEIGFADDVVTLREGSEGTPPPEWLRWLSVSVEKLREALGRRLTRGGAGSRT